MMPVHAETRSPTGTSVTVKADEMNMDCGMDEGNRCLDLCSTQVTIAGQPLKEYVAAAAAAARACLGHSPR